MFLDETGGCVLRVAARSEQRGGICTYYMDLFTPAGETAHGGAAPSCHRQRAYAAEELTAWLTGGGVHRHPRLWATAGCCAAREDEQRIYFTPAGAELNESAK